jgi:hypothetical protein
MSLPYPYRSARDSVPWVCGHAASRPSPFFLVATAGGERLQSAADL